MTESLKIYHRCLAAGDYEQGITELGLIISKADNVGHALSLRSHLFHLMGDEAEALRDLDRAIELGYGSGAIYYDRGCLHHRAKRYRLALSDLCEAVCLADQDDDDGLIDAAEHVFAEIFEEMRNA
jgi:tetratricopeptide (TPR) repeat protein